MHICLVCQKAAINGVTHPVCKTRYSIDGAFASISYKGTVKKLLYSFKYKPYVSDLADILTDFFYEGIIQNEGFMRILGQSNEKLVLVPIPLHSSKLKSRGYNHAQILSDELSKRLNIRCVDILARIKKTPSQFGLKREERRENIAGAFALREDSGVVPRMTVMLVDDILTTGATLQEAAKVLKKAGAKQVWGLALARD